MVFGINGLNYGRPLIPLTLAFMLGIVAAAYLPGYATSALLLTGVSISGMAWRVRQAKSMVFTPLLLFTALGYLAMAPWLSARLPDQHIARFIGQPSLWIEGIVRDLPDNRSHRTRFHMDVELVETADGVQPAKGRLRVNLYGRVPGPQAGPTPDLVSGLGPGDRVRFQSRLRPIRGFRNPGGFDYERHMAFQRIQVTASAPAADLLIQPSSGTGPLQPRVAALRHRIRLLIASAVDPPVSHVLQALLVGDRQALPKTLRDSFNRAGVSHILAISGLHLSIVAGLSFLMWRHLLSYIHWLLWRAWCHRLAAILTVPPLLTYALLAGMSPATQRALIMAGVFLLALALQREHDPLNTVSAAALAILLAHPPTLFRIAFQLSFAAVLSIMAGMYFLSFETTPLRTPDRLWDRLKQGLWQKTRTLFMVSLLAIVGTLPLVMYYFNQAALVGILANMLVVPLIGFLVVPGGLLALLLIPVSSHLGLALLGLTGRIAQLTMHIIEYIAAWPFAAIKTITPSIIEITCYYAISASGLYLWRLHRTNPSDSTKNPAEGVYRNVAGQPQRRLATGVLIAALLVGALDVAYWSYQRFWRADVRITILDVGQGSAALLQLPRGKVMLLDGGGFSDNEIFDVGAFVVAPVLWRQKIRTIDKLILSHPDSDHLNGLLYIAEHFNVRQVWTNGDSVDTQAYQRFREIIEQRALDMPDYAQLPRTSSRHGVTLEILYPPANFQHYQTWQNWRNFNNNSLVLRLQHGPTTLLFPGDIEARAEFELVALHRGNLQSDILIAPHHGSRTSSSPFFLEEVDPSIVVISAGWARRQHFPHPEVAERYAQRGYEVYNTADYGAIQIISDGNGVRVVPMRARR